MSEKKNLRILVVDDEKVVRDFLMRLLTREAGEIRAVESGPQAIEEAKKERFDYYFLDIRMPQMDGVELLGELKKIDPESKFIMMTGYAVDDLMEKAKQLGIYASIRKPFDIGQVVSLLKAPAAEGPRKNALNVLIVDDDETVLDFFKRLLQDKVYEVTTIDKGKEAMSLLNAKQFDMVFLDMVLKDTSGVDLYLKIKESRPELELVLITGYADKVKELEQIGIKHCLTKPFDIALVLEEIKRVRQSKGV